MRNYSHYRPLLFSCTEYKSLSARKQGPYGTNSHCTEKTEGCKMDTKIEKDKISLRSSS